MKPMNLSIKVPAGPSNPVHVVLVMVRTVVVDHQDQVLHVEAARAHARSDQDLHAPLLKIRDCRISETKKNINSTGGTTLHQGYISSCTGGPCTQEEE